VTSFLSLVKKTAGQAEEGTDAETGPAVKSNGYGG